MVKNWEDILQGKLNLVQVFGKFGLSELQVLLCIHCLGNWLKFNESLLSLLQCLDH